MRETSFRVEGEPVGQPRVNPGRWSKGAAYVPRQHPVHAYRHALRVVAAASFSGRPIPPGVPVELTLTFVLRRPKALTWKTKANVRLRAPVKPDLDNLEKACLDALKSVAWHDDAQVVVVAKSKWYAAGGESPHTLVTVKELS